MKILQAIVTNKCIYVPFFVWLGVQIFKTVIEMIKNRNFDFKRLIGAGGMPSSHSAIVTAESVLIGKAEGFNSSIFGLSIIIALIVMYDAAGVRRAAGKQAKVLNKILETPGLTFDQVQEKLVEVLGHTPIQVFVGAIIGIIIAAIA